ncbi:hypothetical protein [Streptomyces sp. NPDC058855]|uniref:hypothetical protein n=1 Tax=Streptomyces sp. NPDC058855 TaxID=3346651 RepID=UPI00368C26BA
MREYVPLPLRGLQRYYLHTWNAEDGDGVGGAKATKGHRSPLGAGRSHAVAVATCG